MRRLCGNYAENTKIRATVRNYVKKSEKKKCGRLIFKAKKKYGRFWAKKWKEKNAKTMRKKAGTCGKMR